MAPSSNGGTPGASARPVIEKPAEKASDLSDLRVIVAGGSGFLGGAISARLESLGAKVFKVSRSLGYDLRNESEVFQAVILTKPDMIVDATGNGMGIGFQEQHQASIFRETMQIGMNLIHVASVSKIHLIAIGSPGSYSRAIKSEPIMENTFWDGYPGFPCMGEGLAKRALLGMMQAYGLQHELQSAFLVPASVYGPGQTVSKALKPVIPSLVGRFVAAVEAHSDVVQCWGVPDVARNFLYVDDFADAVAKACAMPLGTQGPVNLSGTESISIGELAALIARLTGFQGKMTWHPGCPQGTPYRVLDGGTGRQFLGWEPKVSLEEGLTRTIQEARRGDMDVLREAHGISIKG